MFGKASLSPRQLASTCEPWRRNAVGKIESQSYARLLSNLRELKTTQVGWPESCTRSITANAPKRYHVEMIVKLACSLRASINTFLKGKSRVCRMDRDMTVH